MQMSQLLSIFLLEEQSCISMFFNNIYESGYTMATIGFQGYYPFNYMIEGYWSSDSTNTYTDAT